MLLTKLQPPRQQRRKSNRSINKRQLWPAFLSSTRTGMRSKISSSSTEKASVSHKPAMSFYISATTAAAKMKTFTSCSRSQVPPTNWTCNCASQLRTKSMKWSSKYSSSRRSKSRRSSKIWRISYTRRARSKRF